MILMTYIYTSILSEGWIMLDHPQHPTVALLLLVSIPLLTVGDHSQPQSRTWSAEGGIVTPSAAKTPAISTNRVVDAYSTVSVGKCVGKSI